MVQYVATINTSVTSRCIRYYTQLAKKSTGNEQQKTGIDKARRHHSHIRGNLQSRRTWCAFSLGSSGESPRMAYNLQSLINMWTCKPCRTHCTCQTPPTTIRPRSTCGDHGAISLRAGHTSRTSSAFWLAPEGVRPRLAGKNVVRAVEIKSCHRDNPLLATP